MDERERWNARYAARGSLEAGEPNPFLREHLTLLPRGHVLELAMGEGHHLRIRVYQDLIVAGPKAVARVIGEKNRSG
jgi:hypothetical protein